MRNAYKIFLSLKGRDHLADLGVDERITLIWILKKQDVTVWAGFMWLRTGTRGGRNTR
jgi:hypothetical protein